jgi:hypothetical protein
MSKYRTIKTTEVDVDTNLVISESIKTVIVGMRQTPHICQGFVVTSPNHDDPLLIRKFTFGERSIFNHLKEGMYSMQMEHIPVDYDNGMDFRFVRKIRRISGIDYAEYLEVEWTWNIRPLNALERQAVETQGLANLETWL